jgi:WD40 repeat protein
VFTIGEPLCFAPDPRFLAVFNTNFTVEYWDAASGNRVGNFRIPVRVAPSDRVAASPDGRWVAHVSAAGTARVWDRDSGEQVGEIALDSPAKLPWGDFSPDGRWLLVSSDTRGRGGGGWALLWEHQRGDCRRLPGADVYRPSFSRDGKLLATGFGKNVRIWSIPDLKPLATLRGHGSTINGLAFSPDGTLLASIERELEIRLWEVATGRLRHVSNASGSANGLLDAAFSPDGRTLASGASGLVELWNVATGKKILSFKGLSRYVAGATFAPNGRSLVVGGFWPTVPIVLFRAPSLDEIDAAKGAAR